MGVYISRIAIFLFPCLTGPYITAKIPAYRPELDAIVKHRVANCVPDYAVRQVISPDLRVGD